jgi:hypothetical protein
MTRRIGGATSTRRPSSDHRRHDSGLAFARVNRQPFLRWADAGAPELFAMQAVAPRLFVMQATRGNFLNQELHGSPTNLPWAVSDKTEPRGYARPQAPIRRRRSANTSRRSSGSSRSRVSSGRSPNLARPPVRAPFRPGEAAADVLRLVRLGPPAPRPPPDYTSGSGGPERTCDQSVNKCRS